MRDTQVISNEYNNKSEKINRNNIQTTLTGISIKTEKEKPPNLFEKNDEIMYFSSEELMNDIVEHWVRYENLDSFVSNIIDIPSAKYQFNRLCQGYNNVGYNISLLFNPHRLLTETWKEKGIFYGFQDDVKYRIQFARYLVNVSKKVPVAPLYHRHLGVGHKGYQYVQEFPPYLARDIYKIYCKEGDKILNPCAGWGGRLIGLASCMFNNIEYWETDPYTLTYKGLLELKEFLHLGDNYKTFNEPFEELDLPNDYFNFVFTSPPYYDTERYSKEDTQSYMGNNSYEEWRDNFLYPMVDKIVRVMDNDGVCLLNIGKNRFPMDTDIIYYLEDKHDINSYLVDEFKQRLDKNNDGTNKEEKRYERHNGGENFLEFYKK